LESYNKEIDSEVVKIVKSIEEYAKVEQLCDLEAKMTDYTPLHRTLRLEMKLDEY